MLRGAKSSNEVRFELVVTGLQLVVGAVLYVVLQGNAQLQPLIVFFPGLIMLGGAIYQTITPDWRAGWVTYVIAILMVAISLAGLINNVMGEVIHIDWWIIAIASLGIILIFKALYDPSPKD